MDLDGKGGHQRPLCGGAGLRLREEVSLILRIIGVSVNCRSIDAWLIRKSRPGVSSVA